MAQMLAGYDFRLVSAGSLRETMEMAAHLHPNAILTYNQKGRDNQSGLRMTGMIPRDEGHDATGLVMVSTDAIAGAYLWEGRDRFFKKPFIPVEALAEALRELIPS
jgi:CheY-like chemotaxis protein